MKVSWAAKDHADHDKFKVALFTGDDQYDSAEAGYQVFLRVPRSRRNPQEVAADMLAELAKPPPKWRATWHSIKPGVTNAPPMASRRWRHEKVGF